MAEEKLLNIRDAAILLGVSEKEIIELAESGQIPAYKIGGVYLRFRRQQIEDFRRTFKQRYGTKGSAASKGSLREKIEDFLYFNDFYILSALLILLITMIIFKGY